MKSEDQDCTIDDSHSYDSPPKNTKSQSFTHSPVAEHHQRRMLQYQQLFAKFKEQQTQLVTYQVSQVQKSRKQYVVVLVILICLLLLPIYVLDQQMQQLSFRVKELEYSERQLVQEMKGLQMAVSEYNEMAEGLQVSLQNINQEILDLHMNELFKEEKSMFILQKYTNSLPFSIDSNYNFNSHFVLNQRTVRKRTGQEVMFYTSQPVPASGVYFLKIQIRQTDLGMISIGIMPASKKANKCVYCDSSEIYYIYCNNGKIYNGEILSLVNKSKKSRFSQIKRGDTVSMFVDNRKRQVLWYVNSQYAGSENIKQHHKEWYPFVQMTTRGDQVKFLD